MPITTTWADLGWMRDLRTGMAMQRAVSLRGVCMRFDAQRVLRIFFVILVR